MSKRRSQTRAPHARGAGRQLAATVTAGLLAMGASFTTPAPRTVLAATPPSGVAWSWGGDRYGQLGNGISTYGISTPAQVCAATPCSTSAPALNGITAVSAGDGWSLALDGNGRVWAWGQNVDGRLGNGTACDITIAGGGPSCVYRTPVAVCAVGGCANGQLSGITAISAGESHALALTSAGQVVSWGDNWSGELGANTSTTTSVGTQQPYSATPVMVCASEHASCSGTTALTGVTAIAAGYEYSLALTSTGQVLGWGSNSRGQMGRGSTFTAGVAPVALPSGTRATAIAAGAGHGMALTSTGEVWAWGDNQDGELGNGGTCMVSTLGSPAGCYDSTPTRVSTQTRISAIASSSSSYHSLALTSVGEVLAWGKGSSGQIGNGGYAEATTPVPVCAGGATPCAAVLGGMGVIAAGGRHSMAVSASSGQVLAWGDNAEGQLGTGTTCDATTGVGCASSTPLMAVTMPLPEGAIAAGNDHSLAVQGPVLSAVVYGDASAVRGEGLTGMGEGLPALGSCEAGPVATFKATSTSGQCGTGDLAVPGLTVTGGVTESVVTDGQGGIRSQSSIGSLSLQAAGLLSIEAAALSASSSATCALTGGVTSNQESSSVGSLTINGITVTTPPVGGRYVVNPTGGPVPLAVITVNYSRSDPSTQTQVSSPVAIELPPDGPLAAHGIAGRVLLSYATTGCSPPPLAPAAPQLPRVPSTSPLPPSPDLTVSLSHTGALRTGGTITYSVIVGNGGNAPTSGTVTTSDMLPAALSPRMPTHLEQGGWSCDTSGQKVTCSRSDPLDAGQSYPVLSLPTSVLVASRPVSDTVTVSGGGESNTGNDHADDEAWVVPPQATTGSGPVRGWGDNLYGEVGDGTTAQRVSPTAALAPAAGGIVGVAAGSDHSLGLTSSGQVLAWGSNWWGQLGTGATCDRTTGVGCASSTPLPVNLGTQPSGAPVTAVAISAGTRHSLAVTSTGQVLAWGDGSLGELGNGQTVASNTPVPVDLRSLPSGTTVTAVAAGGDFSLALTSTGQVFAWGNDSSGQLGNTGLWIAASGGPPGCWCSPTPLPVSLPSGTTISAIAAGATHGLALTPDGRVLGWGDNRFGELANDTAPTGADCGCHPTPAWATLSTGTEVSAIAAGDFFSLALTGNRLLAWGLDSNGDLGVGGLPKGPNGGSGSSRTPITVILPPGTTVSSIAAGGFHAAAITGPPLPGGLPAGWALAWGENYFGEIGDGTTVDRPAPVLSGGAHSVAAIAAGRRHTLAIEGDPPTPITVAGRASAGAIVGGGDRPLATFCDTGPMTTSAAASVHANSSDIMSCLPSTAVTGPGTQEWAAPLVSALPGIEASVSGPQASVVADGLGGVVASAAESSVSLSANGISLIDATGLSATSSVRCDAAGNVTSSQQPSSVGRLTIDGITVATTPIGSKTVLNLLGKNTRVYGNPITVNPTGGRIPMATVTFNYAAWDPKTGVHVSSAVAIDFPPHGPLASVIVGTIFLAHASTRCSPWNGNDA